MIINVIRMKSVKTLMHVYKFILKSSIHNVNFFFFHKIVSKTRKTMFFL